VVALEPTETVTLSRAVFEEARRLHPELVDVVNQLLAATIERLSQALLEAMYLGVDERVARRLVELAEIYRTGAVRVVVPITQDDLAGMAGTTRPTANLVLGRLADAGAVRLERGRIEVTDLASLRRHGGLLG
jgi:CRP-like cAMP-binding protein